MQGGGSDFETDYGAGDHLEPQRNDWDETPCVELLTIGVGANSEEKRRIEAAAISRKIRWLVSGQEEVKVYDSQKAGNREPGTGKRDLEPRTSNLEPVFLPRKPRFGDIAILFRRFSNLKLFERELRMDGIPYYVVKGKGFYRCQEVLDILNFLKYLEFSGDLVALTGILRSPLCGVSDETLYLLSRCDGGIGDWEKWFARSPLPDPRSPALDRIVQPDRDRLHSLFLLVSRLRPLRDRLTLAELLEEIHTGTDFASTLLTTFQGEQKVANLRKLIELARSFDDSGEGALRVFVNYLTELVKAEPTEAEAVISAEGEDVVRLMTVHQSKGLEFPVVFIPELGAGQPINTTQMEYDNSLGLGMKPALPGSEGEPTLAFREISELRKRKVTAESKRLFYVALTRSRDYLILSGEGRGEWRRWVEDFREEYPALIRITEATSLFEESSPADGMEGVTEKGRGEGIPELVAAAVGRSLYYTPPLPSEMVFSPTALEDYRKCPRKYFYRAVMGLDEGLFAEILGDPGRRRKEKKRGMTALDKGNLAHAMLEKLNFADATPAQRAACERIAAVTSAGQPQEDVADVVESVLAFAATPLACELPEKRLLREYRFILTFSGAATYYVEGAMDLVAEGRDGVTVYDYKYAEKEQAELDGYRFQLGTYMLALSRAYPERRVEGKLLFLKGGGEETVVCDFAAFERELLEIMDAIRRRSAEEDFGLREGCDGTHCPFRERCLAAL
ncbi:MAG: UvrD/REP [Geobacteraceae bacterium]|nr:MAG: UvrD/REP [Geobacteraceae bacterium]